MLKRFMHFLFAGSLLLAISGASFAQTDAASGKSVDFSAFGGTCFDNSAVMAVNACLKQQEEANIKPHANTVKRSGKQLCLNLQQGAPKCLVTKEVESFEHVRYFFVGMLPNQPIAVVYSLHYEWDELHFISLADGSELYMKDSVKNAFASPDGRYMLITQADEMYGVSAEILPINASQPWVPSFTADVDALKESAPIEAQWVSNEEVLLTLSALDTKEPAGEMRVKFDGEKWQSSIVDFAGIAGSHSIPLPR